MKKKELLIRILIFIILCIYFYLAIAFIVMDIDPNSWNEGVRMGFVLCIIGATILVASFPGVIFKDDDL